MDKKKVKVKYLTGGKPGFIAEYNEDIAKILVDRGSAEYVKGGKPKDPEPEPPKDPEPEKGKDKK